MYTQLYAEILENLNRHKTWFVVLYEETPYIITKDSSNNYTIATVNGGVNIKYDRHTDKLHITTTYQDNVIKEICDLIADYLKLQLRFVSQELGTVTARLEFTKNCKFY